MRRRPVKGTAVWHWRKEERRRKYLDPIKKLGGWLLLILVLLGIGWLLGSLMGRGS